MKKYYIDSCIWIDYFENRSDKFRPLGEWALRLFQKIIEEDSCAVYSDVVEEELSNFYSKEEIKNILNIFPSIKLIKTESNPLQLKEAIKISKKYNVPVKDALHSILSLNSNAILVTRDKHFYEIQNYLVIKKPEELI